MLLQSYIFFLFLIKMSMLKAIEIEIAFSFIPLGFPRVAQWIIFYALHTYIDELV